MQKIMFIFVFGLLVSGSNKIWADNFALEVDPATYVFGGYSAHLKYHFAEKWELGLGTYAMTFPNLMNGLAISPTRSTTNLRITSAYALFIDRYLVESNQGLVVGMQFASQHFRLTDSTYSPQSSTYNTTLVMPRIGYKYQFGTSGFYVLPWMGVGYLAPSNSSATIGTQAFKIKNLLPFATIHIGYSF